MLADARDVGRKDDFKAIKATISHDKPSMDNYIQFLHDIQAIYGPFKFSERPIPSHNYKL